MRALIADDDRVAAQILSRTLTRWEFDVSVVGDGARRGGTCRRASGPTLAILDWMMPEVDGAEVCRRVRKDLPLANMYLILLTSLETRKDIVAGLDAGADDYVVKPFDPEELRARVSVGVRVLTLQERLAERVPNCRRRSRTSSSCTACCPSAATASAYAATTSTWQQVESYIADRSEAQFSHGICPACYVDLEKQIDAYKNNRTKLQGLIDDRASSSSGSGGCRSPGSSTSS